MTAVATPHAGSAKGATDVLTVAAQQITVGTADVQLSSVFAIGYCRRIYCNAAGTVFAQRLDDAAAVSYVVTAGQVLDGHFVLIGGTTNHPTASAIALTLEV